MDIHLPVANGDCRDRRQYSRHGRRARPEQMVTLKAGPSLSISLLTKDRLRHVSVIKYRFETKCRNARKDAAPQ